MRELHRIEVIQLEEQERQRRCRSEKTHSEDSVHFSNQKEDVQRELISKINREETAKLEDAERERRVKQDKMEQFREEDQAKFESKADRLVARALEEEERDRRIFELMQQKFDEQMTSELNRRQTWIAEEEERMRRIQEEKSDTNLDPSTVKLHLVKQHVIHDLLHAVNQKVAEKVQTKKTL